MLSQSLRQNIHFGFKFGSAHAFKKLQVFDGGRTHDASREITTKISLHKISNL